MGHNGLICRGCGTEVSLLQLQRSGDRGTRLCPTCETAEFGI